MPITPPPCRTTAPAACFVALLAAAPLATAIGCEIVSGVGDFEVGGGSATAGSCSSLPAPPAGACIEAAASCGCSAGQDGDCDGLREQRADPWPGQPNPAWLVDLLAADPASKADPWWAVQGNAWYAADTHEVRLDDGAGVALTPRCSASFASPDYLAEVALHIDSFVDESRWAVALWSARGVHGSARVCRFFRRLDVQAGQPTLQVRSYGPNDPVPNGQIGDAVGSVAPGQRYLLQSWGQRDAATGMQRHFCRLLSADGTSELGRAQLSNGIGVTPVNSPGTIRLAVSALSIWIGAVRVFDPGP